MKRLLLLALLCCGAFGLSAQSAFQAAGEDATYTLELDQFRETMKRAPLEFTQRKSNTSVSLPLPTGDFVDFSVFSSPLVDNAELGSYVVSGPWGGGRIATSPKGISGVLQGPEGYFVIEPTETGTYRVRNYGEFMAAIAADLGPLACGYDDNNMPDYSDLDIDHDEMGGAAGARLETKAGNEARELRVYDLVMTNTGEFASKFGNNPTQADVLAAFNEATSAVNGIFENEIGIRMNLIEVPGLIFLDDETDPYFNSNQGGELLGQVAPAFADAGVTADLYDLGHLFTAGCSDVGGVVSGRACTNGKTRGVTCVAGSVLGAALRIMAHEIAHQFAVSHSWNTCPGSEGQRAGQTAFEPGSGTTIMSYAGTCGNQNIGGEQSYYHVGSLEQFLRYTREGGAEACATVIETENFTPEVDFDYEDDFYIPVSTPFRLEGDATDANEDNLTFNWEQYDLGPSSNIQSPMGTAPLFRSVAPSATGNVRYFPNLARIVNDIQNNNEVLPTYTREMNFRLVARDNNPQAGGVDWQQVRFFADEAAGPFLVNNPIDDEWNVGDYQEITWDVANTDQAPINCKRVNILMSTNGGNSFDVVLAENVVNDGNAFVTVPEEATSNDAIIMVEAADNIFLNVNLSSFRVRAAEQAVFTLDASVQYEEVCLPDNVSLELNSGSVLGFNAPIALSVDPESLPDGAVANLSENEVVPGASSMLDIDLSGVNLTGRVDITVVAVAEGQDTARRVITLDLVDNDYSDLATVAPAEGTTGIILSTDFEWTEALNADDYDIQIATSPTFAEETIFEDAFGLTDTDYRIQDGFFEPNTLYFWRVRPSNSCGPGAWLDPNSFRTVNSQCENYTKGDAVTLPGTGPSFTRESTLFIEEQGVINDINIPNVNVRYNFASEVSVTLVSPAGTEVLLYGASCFGSTNRVDLGFDDDAPVTVACPPDDERVFIPAEPLSAFNGEDTFGEWVLRVGVNETGGSAGSIESWEIQFCADISAVAPERQVNTATEVPPLGRNSIEGDKLRVISTVYGSNEVNYTLTALPEAGRLLLYGVELGVGDEFQQDDINGAGLFYENTDDEATTDDFGFVVTTPDGGYLATDYHDILITDDATVSNGNVSVLDDNLRVFPNPTDNDLNIRWTATVNRDLSLELYDLNGRMLSRQTVNGRAQRAVVDASQLPAGVYLLRIDGAVRRVVKR